MNLIIQASFKGEELNFVIGTFNDKYLIVIFIALNYI